MQSIIQSSTWKEALRSSMAADNVLDTPMRMLIRKFPDIAEIVLDHCYKEKRLDADTCVEMNFEFIEDTFNYQEKAVKNERWYNNMFRSIDNAGYEHLTKALPAESLDEGFEEPYSKDFDLLLRNHPMMVMVEHSRRVSDARSGTI